MSVSIWHPCPGTSRTSIMLHQTFKNKTAWNVYITHHVHSTSKIQTRDSFPCNGQRRVGANMVLHNKNGGGVNTWHAPDNHCRANMSYIRQSTSDSSPDSGVRYLKLSLLFPQKRNVLSLIWRSPFGQVAHLAEVRFSKVYQATVFIPCSTERLFLHSCYGRVRRVGRVRRGRVPSSKSIIYFWATNITTNLHHTGDSK